MRVLITGGAGFIGSHLADALLESGHTVRALDNLDPQVHPGGRPGLPQLRGRAAGRRRPRPRCGRHARWTAWTRSSTSPLRSASASRCTRSSATPRSTRWAPRSCWRRSPRSATGLSRVLVASSMSIYGEGRYRCPNHGLVAPQVRSDEQLDARQWELRCEICGRSWKPCRPARTSRSGRCRSTPSASATTRSCSWRSAALTGCPRWPCASSTSTATGRRSPTPTPGWRRSSAAGCSTATRRWCSRTASRAATSSTSRTSPPAASPRLETGGADYRAVNLGTGAKTTVLDVARELARGLGVDIEPQIVNKFRAGDIRHCYADISLARELLGFAPKTEFADGMRELLPWVATQQATDTVDSRREPARGRRPHPVSVSRTSPSPWSTPTTGSCCWPAWRTLPAAARDVTLQTIVIDNASTDGSADAVREAHPDVEVVAREHRHGFGANHNEAIRRATGRYVLILNEDTELGRGLSRRAVPVHGPEPARRRRRPPDPQPGRHRSAVGVPLSRRRAGWR